MFKLKNLLLTLVFTTLMSSTLFAENVTVKVIMKNGEENSYTMDANSKITYSESEMYLAAAEGNVTFQIAEIRKVLFEKLDAIEENTTTTLSVYPNPVKDVVILNNTTENQEVTVFSATGSVVMRTVISSENTIDVSSLKDGVYFVKTNNQIAKVIKL